MVVTRETLSVGLHGAAGAVKHKELICKACNAQTVLKRARNAQNSMRCRDEPAHTVFLTID